MKFDYRQYIRERVEIAPTGCWNWTRCVDRSGYGCVNLRSYERAAHRVAYRAWKGEIPEGFQIDHLCRNRLCVNPQHLEAVTQKENWRRGVSITKHNAAKTHCVNGHALSGDNLGWCQTKGRLRRVCRECDRQRHVLAKERRRA